MIKNLGLFILALLGIGTAFSVYLPEYNLVEEPLPEFVFIEQSLDNPADAYLLRPSATVFSADDGIYALQLGVFGSLGDAIKGAQQLAEKNVSLPLAPAIFRAVDPQREWFILAFGPFEGKTKYQQYQNLLTKNEIQSQAIPWLFDQKDE